MKITRRTVSLSLLALAIPALLYFSGYPLFAAVALIPALIICGLLLIAVQGANFFDQRKTRKNFKSPERKAAYLLAVEDGSGFVVDDDVFSMYIEMTPTPYSVSRADEEIDPIPLSLLRRCLDIYGVKPHHLNIISYATRTGDSAAYPSLYSEFMPEDRYSTVRTVIEVTLSMETSMYDVYQRTGTDDPDSEAGLIRGVSNTLYVAARRIVSDLSAHGYLSRLMTRQEVGDFHNTVLGHLNDGILHEQWDALPGETGPKVRVGFSTQPDTLPMLDSHARCALVSRTLTRKGSTANIQTVSAVAHSIDVPPVPGDVVKGHQGDLATRFLPLAHTVDVALPARPVSGDVPAVFPVAGLGVYMGMAAVAGENGGLVQGDIPVYVDLTGTRGDIIYIDAPERIWWAIAARLASIGENVTILSTNEKYPAIAQRLGIDTLRSSKSSRGASVAVLDSTTRKHAKPSKLRTTIVAGADIPRGSAHSISVRENGLCVLTDNGKRTPFFWSFMDGETPILGRAGITA